ncbi:hypothetical protein PFISCL1PPCAC_7166, partial [Pristionchus fissidentatus]
LSMNGSRTGPDSGGCRIRIFLLVTIVLCQAVKATDVNYEEKSAKCYFDIHNNIGCSCTGNTR